MGCSRYRLALALLIGVQVSRPAKALPSYDQFVLRPRLRIGVGFNLDATRIHSMTLYQEAALRFADSSYTTLAPLTMPDAHHPRLYLSVQRRRNRSTRRAVAVRSGLCRFEAGGASDGIATT
jgi:hypothetical protein